MNQAGTEVMQSKRERLLQIIFETSFRYSEVPSFPLASGVLSSCYVDCKMALAYAEARELIGDLILDVIGDVPIDAVGGMALGAYPIGIAVSDAFYRKTGGVVRSFVVRKEAKSHGLKKHIEGDVRKGDRALIVDDVITSGKSTIDAIVKARAEGLQIVRAVALIDREELEGRKNIETNGLRFDSLFTLADLKALVAR